MWHENMLMVGFTILPFTSKILLWLICIMRSIGTYGYDQGYDRGYNSGWNPQNRGGYYGHTGYAGANPNQMYQPPPPGHQATPQSQYAGGYQSESMLHKVYLIITVEPA